jgi:hypothetical protein
MVASVITWCRCSTSRILNLSASSMKHSFSVLLRVQKLRHEVKHLEWARGRSPSHSDGLIYSEARSSKQRVVRIEPGRVDMILMIKNRADEYDADQSVRCLCSL